MMGMEQQKQRCVYSPKHRSFYRNIDFTYYTEELSRLETLNKCAKLLQQKSTNLTETENLSYKINTRTKGFDVGLHVTDDFKGARRNRSDSDSGLYTVTENGFSKEKASTRLSRTFSCSGTFPVADESICDSNANTNSNILVTINNQLSHDIEKQDEGFDKKRDSFYDNVPDYKQLNMRTKSLPNDVTFALTDQYYMANTGLPHDMSTKMHVRRPSSEDDDDALSISSQEEEEEEDDDEEEDEVESVHSLNHLDIPGNFCKTKMSAMGSVDSGVPSSPVMRSPSVRKRRVRWHSFQVSCERESMLVSNKLMTLSAGQLNVLKKLSLLRLTALLERYSCQNRSGWHWTVPKLLKKFKAPDYRDRNVFGVPLLLISERCGSSLPQPIILAINHLSRLAVDSVGIFRKSGMKSRIDKLRTQIESNPEKVDFDGYSVYDVADTLKQYFRELPEPLLTSKLADTFISIHKDVPKELRLQAMQLAIILMPDENRNVLQTLLYFLNDVASHACINQMSEKNLATCFVPAFFHLCGGSSGDKMSLSSAPKKLKRSQSLQCQKELDDTLAAQECLAEMMKCVRFLFCVPDDVMMKCQFTYIEQGEPVHLEDLGQQTAGDAGISDGYQTYVDQCFAGLLQEMSPNSRSSKKWELHSESDEIIVSCRKMRDGYPLRLWRSVTEINASPEDILKRMVKERHLWDDEIVQWEVLETLDETSDVFYYEMQSIAPSVKRDFVILRSWRRNLSGGACGIVMTSIKSKHAPPPSGVRGTLLASRCLIEPVGLGRSRMTYIARTDLRGYSSRYYNKAIAPRLISSVLRRVRDSFNCGPDGPETNV